MHSILLFLITLFYACSAGAEPVINFFDSLIRVQPSSELIVQEKINITTDGRSIKHGIYRDFPTRYKTPDGEVAIQFKILKTELDGQPVQHFEKDLANGQRIYMGDKNRILAAGTYTFTLTYSALGELGYFKDHDELYWNVTGNGWGYPILKARALVNLPKGAFDTITGYTAYTGVQGSREQNYSADLLNNEQVLEFQTTSPLGANQGFTLVVGWKKGFVSEVSFYQLAENQLLLTMGFGALLLLLYYFLVWFWVKPKTKARVVIPEYEPPEGYSPAALRYILRMGCDKKVLASAVLSLAVKGFLKIRADEPAKNYTLIKEPDFKAKLPSEETLLGQILFAEGKIFSLKQQAADIIEHFSNRLEKVYQADHFVTNYAYKLFGVVLTFAVLVLMALMNDKLWVALFVLMFFLVTPLILASQDSSRLLKKIRLILFLCAYFAFLILFVYAFTADIFAAKAWIYSLLFFSLAAINLAFYYWLNFPTKLGQDINTHSEGFRLFLNATEKDRLNFRNPPDLTPEVFEKYLPYALALGVEQRWAEQFAAILAKADYQPGWYTGTVAFSSVVFASAVGGSFTNAISSSSSAPGSSSGFGSSGSSGGGGGGGGGGGW